MAQALGHLDESVRFAAISALAETPEPEAANALDPGARPPGA